jgi:peptidoglycan/LPS O-acetylase OafA/YrhL
LFELKDDRRPAAAPLKTPAKFGSLKIEHAKEYVVNVNAKTALLTNLAFMMREKLSRVGSLVPGAAGLLLLSIFAEQSLYWAFPLAMFMLIVGFANLDPSSDAWWRKPAIRLGNTSYSIYLIHPMVFLVASAADNRFSNWSEEPIRAACIVATIAISLLCWKYFELPMIEMGHRVAARPRRSSSAVFVAK